MTELDLASTLLRDPSTAVAQRFQQTSGMVMAKGVEDSAFYRFTRLGSLTEVGGEPDDFAESVERFHERQARRQAEWPTAMTTLTTHDTKRGEDVRARIDVLSEAPQEWAQALDTLERIAGFGDPTFANLLWQAAVGGVADRARPAAGVRREGVEGGRRLHDLDRRRTRRSRRRLRAAVDAVYDDDTVAELIERIATRLDPAGWSNGLSMKLLQLTAPGVPDVYQGSELWERSLVDPDNRRPVDFARRRELLAEIDEGALPDIDETGRRQAAGRREDAAPPPRPARAVHGVHAARRDRAARPTTSSRSIAAARSRSPPACRSASPSAAAGATPPSTSAARR